MPVGAKCFLSGPQAGWISFNSRACSGMIRCLFLLCKFSVVPLFINTLSFKNLLRNQLTCFSNMQPLATQILPVGENWGPSSSHLALQTSKQTFFPANFAKSCTLTAESPESLCFRASNGTQNALPKRLGHQNLSLQCLQLDNSSLCWKTSWNCRFALFQAVEFPEDPAPHRNLVSMRSKVPVEHMQRPWWQRHSAARNGF